MTARWLRSIVSALLLAALASGCAVVGGSPEHIGGRATLGDAAQASNPDSAKQNRPLRVGYTLPPEPEYVTSTAGSALTSDSDERDEGAGPGSVRGAPASDPNVVVGLVAGGGAIAGTGFDGFGEFGLSLGGYASPRVRIDVLGTLGLIQFANETIAGQSFLNEVDLNLDATVRYYLTAAHTFVGVYPLAGLRAGTMFWEFARPVTIREDGEDRTVTSDRIDHMSFYGGLGLSLVQLRHVYVGATLFGGARLYAVESSNGFSNTLFPDVGFVQLRVEAGYRK